MISYPTNIYGISNLKSKDWDALSGTEKKNLKAGMLIWDPEFEIYFRVNYATKAVEIGIDVIY
jgi:hypothetical protein